MLSVLEATSYSRMHTSDGGPSSPAAVAPVFLYFFHRLPSLPSLYRLAGHSGLITTASSVRLQLWVTGPRTWTPWGVGGASDSPSPLQTNPLWVISSSNGSLSRLERRAVFVGHPGGRPNYPAMDGEMDFVGGAICALASIRGPARLHSSSFGLDRLDLYTHIPDVPTVPYH